MFLQPLSFSMGSNSYLSGSTLDTWLAQIFSSLFQRGSPICWSYLGVSGRIRSWGQLFGNEVKASVATRISMPQRGLSVSRDAPGRNSQATRFPEETVTRL